MWEALADIAHAQDKMVDHVILELSRDRPNDLNLSAEIRVYIVEFYRARFNRGAVSSDGRREIVGLGIGPSEAEPFWSGFLKGLVERGLKGVKLVISDAHDGLHHAIHPRPQRDVATVSSALDQERAGACA